jgi:hypothetical protein
VNKRTNNNITKTINVQQKTSQLQVKPTGFDLLNPIIRKQKAG